MLCIRTTAWLGWICCLSVSAVAADLETDLQAVRSVGHEGTNSPRAAEAVRAIASRPVADLPAILAGFDDANPLAANLLAAAVQSLADRAQRSNESLPKAELKAFVEDTNHSAHGRRLAFELLRSVDPAAANAMIPQMLLDPGAEFRREAVARLIEQAKQQQEAGEAESAKSSYQKALTGAVHEDQVREIIKGLEPMGVTVDLPGHFGFLMSWNAIGPFDNRGLVGFDTVYSPETETNYAASYQGQDGVVTWTPLQSDDVNGVVDIGKLMKNWKGSAMYLAGEFESPEPQAVEFRLATPNAWKLWVNDELLFAREEYHRGTKLDQYRVPANLKKGPNKILIKLLQNEQTQEWAQAYEFRLRVTDATGSAVPQANEK